MPITLGILAQSRQAVATGAFQLLESTVLTGAQASVEFTNLTTKYAADYQHLQIRGVARTSRSSTGDPLSFRFNGSNSTYPIHGLTGSGSSVSSYGFANEPGGYINSGAAGNSAASNAFGAFVLDILDPFETTKNTTARTLSGNPTFGLTLDSSAWINTASITSISIFSGASFNLLTGSRFSLYGIKATA
jgi:hypothetical protein